MTVIPKAGARAPQMGQFDAGGDNLKWPIKAGMTDKGGFLVRGIMSDGKVTILAST